MLLTLIYAAVGGIALLVLLIALLFGGDADADIDLDADMDADFDGDMDAGGGSHWLSLKVIGAFFTAFGSAGAAASANGISAIPGVAIATGAGLAVGAAANFLIAFFYSQQSNSSYSAQNLKGKQGIVTLGIMPGQWGEVQAHFGSTTITRRAKAVDENARIEQGTTVDIVSADSTAMIVRKANLE